MLLDPCNPAFEFRGSWLQEIPAAPYLHAASLYRAFLEAMPSSYILQKSVTENTGQMDVNMLRQEVFSPPVSQYAGSISINLCSFKDSSHSGEPHFPSLTHEIFYFVTVVPFIYLFIYLVRGLNSQPHACRQVLMLLR